MDGLKGGGVMIAPHKSECPAVTGHYANLRTNAEIVLPAEKTGNAVKAFKTLQARFALIGHTLQRTDSADGAVTFYVTRWGLIKPVPTLEDAERFLLQIGGRNVL